MLKGMVASYSTSLDTLKSNIAGIEMTANKHPLVDIVRNQQDQFEELGQITSALISNNSVSSLKSSQSTTLNLMIPSVPSWLLRSAWCPSH